MDTLAAIDIGSNGVRFLIARRERGRWHALLDQRAPIRLGAESFTHGEISMQSIRRLSEAFLWFRRQLQKFDVLHLRAVATSALRDARNGHLVIHEVWRRTGIKIELISGLTEAQLLHEAVTHVVPVQNRSSLLIDMGGGSLEVVSQKQGRIDYAMSLRLGTVRLLKRFGPDGLLKDYTSAIRRELSQLINQVDTYHDLIRPQILIGTGGNLKTLARLSAQMNGAKKSTISISDIETLCDLVFSHNNRQRQTRLGLRPDRADVIRPAIAIVREMMWGFNFDRIFVPNIGLKNGVILSLARHLNNQPSANKGANTSTIAWGTSI